jgi:hypothetical protein
MVLSTLLLCEELRLLFALGLNFDFLGFHLR